ncbi:MAG: hypothetical protein Q8S26_11655 [Azonexus sp.]|nr:hypothetical protein [Azonexus sp.]
MGEPSPVLLPLNGGIAFRGVIDWARWLGGFGVFFGIAAGVACQFLAALFFLLVFLGEISLAFFELIVLFSQEASCGRHDGGKTVGKFPGKAIKPQRALIIATSV